MFPRANAAYQNSLESYSNSNAESSGQEDVVCLMTRTFDTRRTGPDGGRPDVKNEIWNWVTSSPLFRSLSSTTLGHHDFESILLSSPIRSSHDVEPNKPIQREKICVIVSGPDGLVRDTRNIVAQLVCEGWDVEVWVEKFGW